MDFARTNSFQRAVGTQHHIRVHQSRAGTVINSVAQILANLLPQLVFKVVYLQFKINFNIPDVLMSNSISSSSFVT